MTKAAQELLVSQPTLSKQLADLEDELGVKLFIRGHRQITLTDEGEHSVQLADQTTVNIEGNQIISGQISIGAGESSAMNRVIQVLSEIIKDYLDVKIHLISGNADEMETALKHGTIDFAVLMANRSLDNYHHIQIPESDQWGLVMRKDDPLANNAKMTPKDLV